ncbi:MAG: ABC transporter substrate-binding protein, partial [Snowella sp.]
MTLWTSLLLLIVLTISLNGCTIDQLASQPGQLQGNILVLLPLNDESNRLINISLQDFKSVNPQVNIIIEYHPQDELLQRFIKDSQKGLGATAIIDFSRKIPELANLGSIQPIAEKSIDLSRYFAPMLNQIRYRGKIYGIPLGSQTRILCYNQAKLKMIEDPILSQPPTKLDGLIERAIKGYSVGMVSSFEDTFWGIGSFGGSLIDAKGNINPQFEGWAKWLEWLKSAAAQPNFGLMREKRDILHQAFAQGKLAYYVCNANEIDDLRKALHNDFNVAL